MAEEEVELGRVQPLDSLVVDREMENDEEVIGVLVDLRPLALREHVLDVQRVPFEALGKLLGLAPSGTERLIQVRPLALSSVSRGSARGRSRRRASAGRVMRGSLAISTERVVSERGHRILAGCGGKSFCPNG